MAGQHKRGSPLALGTAGEHGHSAKRPRGPVVFEDDEEGEVSTGSEGEGALVAVAKAMEEPQITFTFGVSLFNCQACLLPLKLPTFKCEVAHVVCSGCCAKHGQACTRTAAYAACPELDAILRDAKLPCMFAEFGCKNLVVYHMAADHHRACPSAPCSCPVPGCGASASPALLAAHFHDRHSWPVTAFRYGRPATLPLPAPLGCHVLVGEREDDGCVFLVSPCAPGGAAGGVTAVTLVCVRASGAAAAGQRFWCKLWAELPSNKDRMSMITSTVGSSDLSRGLPADDQNMYLAVPSVLLHDVSGEAPQLFVVVDKDKGAGAAKSSTTAAKRNLKRLQ